MSSHRGLLHHININVSNVIHSSKFYGPMLRYFGYELVEAKHDGGWPYEDWTRWELDTPHMISLSSADISQPFAREARQSVGRFNHMAFAAADRADVDRFHAEVLVPLAKEGLCEIEDAPVDCPEYGEGYYATFFFDPDGIKYEFVIVPGYLKRKQEREKRESKT
ncbi:MAG: glyoxalase/bleomycin resistance protein/dioxygenase [Verrucomicrobia bacterium]|nr:glyoxalase/bleomycin resistance protein/dioxygenase [Verrucomicrobiota bacterium]